MADRDPAIMTEGLIRRIARRITELGLNREPQYPITERYGRYPDAPFPAIVTTELPASAVSGVFVNSAKGMVHRLVYDTVNTRWARSREEGEQECWGFGSAVPANRVVMVARNPANGELFAVSGGSTATPIPNPCVVCSNDGQGPATSWTFTSGNLATSDPDLNPLLTWLANGVAFDFDSCVLSADYVAATALPNLGPYTWQAGSPKLSFDTGGFGTITRVYIEMRLNHAGGPQVFEVDYVDTTTGPGGGVGESINCVSGNTLNRVLVNGVQSNIGSGALLAPTDANVGTLVP